VDPDPGEQKTRGSGIGILLTAHFFTFQVPIALEYDNIIHTQFLKFQHRAHILNVYGAKESIPRNEFRLPM
jgi:hypothetical protein